MAKNVITIKSVKTGLQSEDLEALMETLLLWMAQDEFGNATIHWAQHKPKKLERTEKVLIN